MITSRVVISRVYAPLQLAGPNAVGVETKKNEKPKEAFKKQNILIPIKAGLIHTYSCHGIHELV